MRTDDYGDRMKTYEAQTDYRLDTTLPIYARIDGRSFSKFTQGMKRPFDERMSSAMINTTKKLVEKTHARIGYTQSDEISLVFMGNENSDIFFGGRVQKLASVMAGIASVEFLKSIQNIPDLAHYADRSPHFDCRIVQLPTEVEAANMMLWREMDATKNAISMAAQAEFSSRMLECVNGVQKISMLKDKGIEFDDYPDFFKRGTWVRRTTVLKTLTDEELAGIPDEYRPDPGHLFTRSEVKVIDMPSFRTVTNRVGVVFNQEDPIV